MKLDCRQLTIAIQAIRSKKAYFEDESNCGNYKEFSEKKAELLKIIDEIEDRIWSLEVLTKESLGKQYDDWHEAYQDLDRKYQLPSKDRVLEFLQKDYKFIELLKTKEKQGLIKMIIAPAPGFYSLGALAHKIEEKIYKNGGLKQHYYSDVWQKMLSSESEIRYFGTFDNFNGTRPQSIDGVNGHEIIANPNKHGICDGWIISFTTDEQNVSGPNQLEVDTGHGRKTIKTGLSAPEYMANYYSDEDEIYKGEESMIPQEHFALFAKDLYEKYIKIGKKIEKRKSSDLFDSVSRTWFISTYLPGKHDLPRSGWSSAGNQFYCNDSTPEYRNNTEIVGVRSVVRRKIKT